MTTQTRRFWESPEFSQFLPYIKATAAGDKRHFAHPRFDLKSSTPWQVSRDALAYRTHCVACGALMAPFRQRKGISGIYLGVSCEQDRNNACSRGNAATHAYDAIWALVRGAEPPQGSLL